jgi:hypothetical protein
MKTMGALISLVLFLLCCIGAAVLLYNLGFWSFPLPERPFTAGALLLSTEDLGNGWILSESEDKSNDKKSGAIIIEEASRSFIYRTKEGDLINIVERVDRCDNKIHARSYLREDRLYFGDDPLPDALANLFQPHYADDWLLFVTRTLWHDSTSTFWRYSAVYDEYYVHFGIGPISVISNSEEGTLIYERLGQWLHTLDERAGQLLGKVP